jgi:uncharacterized protein
VLIIYLDTSALLKRYIQENGSEEVGKLLGLADGLGSSSITHTEMAAAMSRATRMGAFPQEEAQAAWKDFLTDWASLTRLKVSAPLIERAAALAWEYGLRGYDAIHLASALVWQDSLEMPVTLATFDRELWLAAQKAGMTVWPEDL